MCEKAYEMLWIARNLEQELLDPGQASTTFWGCSLSLLYLRGMKGRERGTWMLWIARNLEQELLDPGQAS
jgi:hypothetical protein